MRFVLGLVLFMFTCTHAFANEDVDNLIGQLQQQSDLSETTKKESIGHVSILTRQDIDMLRLSNIKELLKYVRFLGYSENELGLPEAFYSPYSSKSETYLKVYIDNQPLSSPYLGSSLQFFANINLNFIDNIEIYWGLPSFTFGLGTSYTIIKLNTKKPNRENTTTLNIQGGSYGTYDANGYAAYEYDDFSYLLSVDVNHLNRKNQYKHKDFPLKRNQNTNYLYSNFTYKKNHKFTFSALKAKYDTFIGLSGTMKPTNNNLKLYNLYFAYDFVSNDNSVKFNISYSNNYAKIHDEADPILDFSQNYKITSSHKEPNDSLASMFLSKEFTTDNNTLEIGIKAQAKKYTINSLRLNNKKNIQDNSYNKERITSIYFENKYLINEKNLLVAAGIFSKYFRNSYAPDENFYGLRAGYIHNDNFWFLKTYIFYNTQPKDFYQFYNYGSFVNKIAKSESTLAYSAELGVKDEFTEGIFSYGKMNLKNKTRKNKIQLELYSFSFLYNFNIQNYIKSVLWYAKFNLGDNATFIEPEIIRRKGAFVTFFNNYEKFNFANTLSYYYYDAIDEGDYSFDTTISYNANKNLQFYIKGQNLFKSAQKGNFVTINNNINTGLPILTKGTFDLYDRVILLGVEYSF